MYDELVERLRFAYLEEDADGIVRILEEAADAIEKLSKPRWIPVAEKLPEAWRRVIVCAKHDGGLSVWDAARWSGKRWEKEMEVCYDYWTKIDEPVTHWMPLPQPPEEE